MVLAALLFLLVLALSAIPAVNEAQLRLGDSLFRAAPAPRRPSRVVLVLVDDESLRRFGRWPWSRSVVSRLVRALDQAGASVIGLDILFAEPQNADADAELGGAFRSSGKVILVDKIGMYPDGPHWIEPLPQLAQSALAIGHAQAVLDRDGVCRRFPARELTPDGSRWPFALEMARAADRSRLEAFLADYAVPSNEGSSRITIAKPLLVPIAFRRGHFTTISAATVLRGGDLTAMAGRPVIVGFGPTEIGDRISTPVSGEMPSAGAEVHAQILDSVLAGRRLREMPLWAGWLTLFAVCLLVVVLCRYVRGWTAAGWLLLTAAIVYGGALASLIWAAWFVPVGPGLLSIILAPVLVYSADFVLVERSVARQLRELRAFLGSGFGAPSRYRHDLLWRLDVLQRLQRELGSVYEVHAALLEATEDLVAVFDAEGHLLLKNQRFASAFGPLERSTANEVRERLATLAKVPLVEDPPITTGEAEIAGELYSVRIAPLPATTLSPGGGTIITLASLRARVERDRARDEALGFVTHELRTPLVAIQGFAEVMMRYPTSPSCATAPETIFRESKRLLALINSYLDVLRLESGAQPKCADAVRLEDIVRDIFEVLHPLASASNMYFVLEESETTPILADAPLLAGAVLNLVSNAIRYGRPGSEIRVKCTQDEGRVALRVHNYGDAISPEELSRLFDPYYRAPRAETTKGGSGLGLAFVKRIAEKHGGSVRVESEANGTWFEIELAAATAKAAKEHS